MDLTLLRRDFREDGIFGEIDIGNDYFFTLEHSYDLKPKLPDGKYTCKRGEHKLHDGIPFEAFEVMDVPGHTGILFHIGNYNRDSEGCILLGLALGAMINYGVMLVSSKQAFKKFMDIQKECDEFNLIVRSSSE